MTPESAASRHLHPISVVAERTGLTPDLLRIWERRYGVVEPARDEGGRRLYSDKDIERLRLLAQATAGGRSIGQLLELDTVELSELVRSDEAARRRSARAPAADTEGDGAEDGFVARALEHTRALDAAALEAELMRAAATVGAARFMDGVIAPLFRRIGDAWHAGTVSIAQEHMASAVAHPVMARVRGALPVAADAPGVVVAVPAEERHEIGALLAAGTAALEGWRVTYLGADMPAADIAAAARETGARMVALSSVYANPQSLVHELRVLRAELPADIDVVIGGQGVSALNVAGDVPGVDTLPDLAALRKRLAVE
jgi:MerR family transcriptional regulator, light-induced transcriptional regulator